MRVVTEGGAQKSPRTTGWRSSRWNRGSTASPPTMASPRSPERRTCSTAPRKDGLNLDMMKTTFFVGRTTLLPCSSKGMALWAQAPVHPHGPQRPSASTDFFPDSRQPGGRVGDAGGVVGGAAQDPHHPGPLLPASPPFRREKREKERRWPSKTPGSAGVPPASNVAPTAPSTRPFSPPSSSLPTQTFSTLPLLSTRRRVGVPGNLDRAEIDVHYVCPAGRPALVNFFAFPALFGLFGRHGGHETSLPSPFDCARRRDACRREGCRCSSGRWARRATTRARLAPVGTACFKAAKVFSFLDRRAALPADGRGRTGCGPGLRPRFCGKTRMMAMLAAVSSVPLLRGLGA